jgi:DNA-binding response OmpR family regulator
MATILIVDEETSFRYQLHDALHQEHIVLEASNGTEGLFLYDLYHPDILITDLMLLTKAGAQLLWKLRLLLQSKKTKVIAISPSDAALIPPFNKEQISQTVASSIGADISLLKKPLSMGEIKATIANLIQNH